MKMYCYRSKDSIEKPEDSSEVIDPEPNGKSGEFKLCQTCLRKWYEINILQPSYFKTPNIVINLQGL